MPLLPRAKIAILRPSPGMLASGRVLEPLYKPQEILLLGQCAYPILWVAFGLAGVSALNLNGSGQTNSGITGNIFFVSR